MDVLAHRSARQERFSVRISIAKLKVEMAQSQTEYLTGHEGGVPS